MCSERLGVSRLEPSFPGHAPQRRAAKAVFGNIDDFNPVAGRDPGPLILFGSFKALPAHLVTVPTIIARELEVFVGDLIRPVSNCGAVPVEEMPTLFVVQVEFKIGDDLLRML